MDDLSKWIVHDTPAVSANGPAVIDLFVVEKVTGIEKTDAIDHLAPNKIITTWHPVAFSY